MHTKALALAALSMFLGACFDPVPHAGDTDTADTDTAGATDESGPGESGPGESESGPGESESGPGESESGPGESDTGASACVGANACVEDAPPGWDGPGAIYVGDSDAPPPACGVYPDSATTTFEDLAAPDAACDCACGDPTGEGCSGGTLRQYSGFNCVTLAQNSWDIGQSCVNLDSGSGSRWRLSGVEYEAEPCAPQPSMELPEVGFDTAVLTCEGAVDAGGCEQGVCLPTAADPFEPGLCVWTEGDVACPGGTYSERTVRYTDFQDDRGCDACACAAPEGECSTAQVSLISSSCGNLPFTTIVQGSCTAAGSSVGAVDLLTGGPSGSCAPVGGETATGEVTPTSAVTYCCAG